MQNKHNFSSREAVEKTSHLIRIEQVKIDDHALQFRGSKKKKHLVVMINSK